MSPPAVGGPADATARSLVAALGLEPHPEGGWFRRVWTAPPGDGVPRAAGSAIHYLVEGGAASRWHRIDASELWTRVDGAPIVLSLSDGSAEVEEVVIGGGTAGHTLHHVVPPGVWQSARSIGDWSLAVCVVVPEFVHDGFELAPPGWHPGRG